jgi:flagellar motor switch protein FliM
MSEEPLLRPEEVQGVISGVDGEAKDEAAASAGEGPQPYSLREPVAIPADAEERAKKAIEQLASTLEEELRRELETEVSLEAEGLQQLRAEAALSVLQSPVWIVPFRRVGSGGMALAMPAPPAMSLVELALGGPGSAPESGREPTALEARVLVKLFSPAAKRIGELLHSELSPGSVETGAVPPSVAAAGETVGVGHLRLKIGESEHSTLLLATASLLLPSSAGKQRSASSGAGPLAPRLAKVPVRVRPVLKAGRVSLGDLMQLEPGKILSLDVPETAPVELQVEGEACFIGQIVRQDDQPVFTVRRRRGQVRPAARRES